MLALTLPSAAVMASISSGLVVLNLSDALLTAPGTVLRRMFSSENVPESASEIAFDAVVVLTLL